MDYNQAYEADGFYWGLRPDELVKASVPFLPAKAKVLDLGCGEGKNAFFLAQRGFDVTAVDVAEIGLKKLKKYAAEQSTPISTHHSDLVCFLENSQEFDAVFAQNVLQFLPQRAIGHAISLIQEKTKSKGLNAVSSFLAETPKQKQYMHSKGMYFFDEDELRSHYGPWQLHSYREWLGDWETHGLPRHRHFIVEVLAQKL